MKTILEVVREGRKVSYKEHRLWFVSKYGKWASLLVLTTEYTRSDGEHNFSISEVIEVIGSLS